MKYVIALVIWVALLTPAINAGKAWQSQAIPGPTVSVGFPSGAISGHVIYKMDGSSWLIDESGRQRRIRGDEVISSTKAALNGQNDPVHVLIQSWRGFAPVVILTAILFAVIGEGKRWRYVKILLAVTLFMSLALLGTERMIFGHQNVSYPSWLAEDLGTLEKDELMLLPLQMQQCTLPAETVEKKDNLVVIRCGDWLWQPGNTFIFHLTAK